MEFVILKKKILKSKYCFVKFRILSGNASFNEETETRAISDIEVLSLPSNNGDQLLALHYSNFKNGKFVVQRIPSLATLS